MKLELELPPDLENALSARARVNSRSLEDEARRLLQASLTLALENELEQLPFLDDTELWRVASQQVSLDESEQVQDLADRHKMVGLDASEADTLARLQRYGQRVMRLRAEAAALLAARGHNVGRLLEQP